jgi:hypothetical protein
MRALSLYEPWATLIALGEKRYETRSWSTTYRGPLLICASKRRLPIYQYPPIGKVQLALNKVNLLLDNLNWGRAVCWLDLIEIYQTEQVFLEPMGTEQYFGDFSPGRFAWKLENVRRFKAPPVVRGKQGLFNVNDLHGSLETYDPI